MKTLEDEVPHLSDVVRDTVYKFRFQTLNSSCLCVLRLALNIANVCVFEFCRSQEETTEQPPPPGEQRESDLSPQKPEAAGWESQAWLDTLPPVRKLAPSGFLSISTAEC